MTTNGYPPEETTPADSPLARAARDALRGPMARFRADIEERLSELEGRLCEALVNSCSPKFIELDQRVGAIERHLDTEPCPPPTGGE